VHLELRHLRALCAIADAGSLTRAAAGLGVSQPALSAQLRRIELMLDGRVFERSGLGVTPTAYGRFVITRARSALTNADELMPAPEPGVARFGGVSGPSLVGLLRRVFALLPDVEVTVRTENSPRLLLDLLTARYLDAAALTDHPGHELPVRPAVESRVVAAEPVFVALPDGHRLAGQEEVALAELAADAWVLPPPDGTGWPDAFVAACARAGFTPKVPYLVAEPPTRRGLIASGRAVSPYGAGVAAGPGVTVRPLAGTPLWRWHLIAWRRDGAFAGIAGELARLAGEAYEEAIACLPHHRDWLARHPDSPLPQRPARPPAL
jgi:DNA-binding transcriptional LysR family regulator